MNDTTRVRPAVVYPPPPTAFARLPAAPRTHHLPTICPLTPWGTIHMQLQRAGGGGVVRDTVRVRGTGIHIHSQPGSVALHANLWECPEPIAVTLNAISQSQPNPIPPIPTRVYIRFVFAVIPTHQRSAPAAAAARHRARIAGVVELCWRARDQ
ncbi:hypothetical protein BD779DRAFT_1469637 [Infundibulicybe gibba]|nr:hypothetical protein BD779DRAFT_1469637 [Infundibulicybe gibba]